MGIAGAARGIIQTSYGPRMAPSAELIEAAAAAAEAKALGKTKGIKPRHDYNLTGHDLLAWMRSWRLSVDEAAWLLLTRQQNIATWIAGPDALLPRKVAAKLWQTRVKSRKLAFYFAATRGQPRLEKDRPDEYVRFIIRGVKHPRYLREAYTHGLDVLNLAYWRFLKPGQTRSDPPVGCLVAHMPTRIAAECILFSSFTENRSHAESALAGKMAAWARESVDRAPLSSFEQAATDGVTVKKRKAGLKRARKRSRLESLAEGEQSDRQARPSRGKRKSK